MLVIIGHIFYLFYAILWEEESTGSVSSGEQVVLNVNHKQHLCATRLHRLFVSKHEQVQHVNVRVLEDDVGFSVVLEMSVIPPVGRGPLRKS